MNAIAHASAAPARGPKLDNRRVLAGVVDLVIVAAGAGVVLFAGDALSSDMGQIRGALGAVVLGWALYYFFALESGDGQTVGKKLTKLRVVRADGSPAGMREIAVRTILRVVDNYLVGLIVMLATGERRQRIGDLAADTIVVDASGPAVAAPAAEPAEDVEAAGDDEPEDAAPGVEASTITLPSRPGPPETLADLTAPEAPAATDTPEMRPFPPVDEPVAEDELPDIASPSIQELAEDVAAAQAEDAEVEAEEEVEVVPVAEEPVAEEPVAEDVVVEEVVVDDATPADDEPVNVKSVETVSAIDLIMGGSAEDEGSEESSRDPEDQAS